MIEEPDPSETVVAPTTPLPDPVPDSSVPSSVPSSDATVRAHEALLQQVTDSKAVSDADKARTDAKSAEDDRQLRLYWADQLMRILKRSLVTGTTIFVAYLAANRGRVPGSVMEAFLGAVVVHVILLVAIVVHYLFPRRDR